MRRLASACLAAVALFAAGRAEAAGICDPGGHFCIQLDTTSARVCMPLAPGGLGGGGCEADDGDTAEAARQIETMTRGTMKAVGFAIVRFDDWYTIVTVVRRSANAEVTGDAGAREALAPFARFFDGARPAGWVIEETQPPSLLRLRGVQVARVEDRMSTTRDQRLVATRTVAFDVRTRDAAYIVTFDSADADATRLERFADAAMGTLDALPVKTAGDATDALVWLVRALIAAAVLVGVGWLWGRRKGGRGGIDARDLWPH